MQTKDVDGSVIRGVLLEEGGSSVLNITQSTLVKVGPGRLAKVSVVVAGSGVGTINDCATTGAAAAANQIGTAPTALGTTTFNWPCFAGIVIVPGTGQTIAVSYS